MSIASGAASGPPRVISDAGAGIYRQIVDSTTTGIWTLDERDVITVVNPAMARTLGYTPEQMLGRSVLDFVEPVSIINARRDLAACRAGAGARLELPLRRLDGEIVWMLASVQPIDLADGTQTGSVAMLTELGELHELQDRMRSLADRDSLTGLYNRPWLVSELERRLDGAARTGRGGAVLLLDIDNFAMLSELYGHAATDEMLKTVADVLSAPLRDGESAARTGSDDFAIVLAEATWREALTVAKYIRSQLRARSGEPAVTASVGIALFDGREELVAEDLLLRGEIARRAARDNGGDQPQVYANQSNAVAGTLAMIRAGVWQERLVLFGEPIVDLRSGRIVRHELLIRMLSEAGELIAPDAFVPTAERFGMIGAIDRWVASAALSIARAGTAVSINLSARSIGDTTILAAVRDAIAAGVDPAAVVFEITESAALTDMDAAREFSERLAALGVCLALDDFGAGFASLRYLKHVPAAYLKIDREFIRDLRTGATDQELVKGIVGIARSLGKRTIAEGVPDVETLALLRGYGVELAQGRHVGAPRRFSPPTEFERSLPGEGARASASAPAARPSGPEFPRDPYAVALSEPELRGPRVLVAEDNEVNQLAALRLLEKCGCHVDLVENGRRAVERSAEVPYSVILMDCELPVLDGYEAVRTIRRRESGARRTPIIAMTANTEEGDRERYLAAGADAYLTKPLRWATLKQTVSELVAAPDAVARASEVALATAGDEIRADERADPELIDQAVLSEVAHHEPGLAGDIVSLFCEESRRQIGRLDDRIEAGDGRGAYAVVSRLKGGASDVGARRMLAVCDRMGVAASGGYLGDLRVLQVELEQAFSQTERALSPQR